VKANIERLNLIILSYAELFFGKNVFAGYIIFFLTFLNPHQGISGFLSIVAAYTFSYLIGFEKEFLKSSCYTYNALLVGLAIGHIFSMSPVVLLLIAITSIITFLLTISISDVFLKYFSLPILSTPFVIVTSLIYLSASKLTNLDIIELYSTSHIDFLNDFFPFWIKGLLRAFGGILFMPNPLVGLIILLVILFQSRILFLLAVTGYYFGVFLQGTFIGSYYDTFKDVNAFNYPLIAMALGGIFNIPSIKSYIFAFTGIAMATVLMKSIDIFGAGYNVPVFTLPFLLVTFCYIYVLSILQYKNRPLIHKDNPEKTAEYFYTQQSRYPKNFTMYLPFLDAWFVYQGFDGSWTHKGIWKYAYDFVKKNSKGLTYNNEGKFLEDYLAFRKPVTSPCRGIVIFIADYYVDNPIGVVDTLNNWGNCVVIKDYRGYYVSLCHLAQGSIIVRPGDWVEIYQQIGLCGNSGYSPQPHIHMQYQLTGYLNSITVPFTFVGLQSENRIFQHMLPEVDQKIEPIFVDAFYYQVTNFVLGEKLSFKVYKNEKFVENIEFVVQMAADGTFYLSRNQSKLYFGKLDSTFYFYHLEGNDSYLKMLYQAIPSFPLSYKKGVTWKDVIPKYFFPGMKYQTLSSFKNIFNFTSKNNADYTFESDVIITGKINDANSVKKINTKVTLDPYYKFINFEVDNFRFTGEKVLSEYK
jgi:urea transporter/murein DD-endopeptidase MepM/ murein hydrolase activator NlpD